jgi:hypothetical protein
MGFFSYDCKECDHSILSSYSTDPEINEWMKDAVVLTPNGSRIIGEYGGYGDIGGMSSGEGDIDHDAVWVHQACWEVAGKPDYDRYDGPSGSARDQGFFFGKEHDLIDPRIKDEAERERLLAEGIVVREARWYDGRARKVAEWLDPKEREYHDEDKRKEPWRHRFTYFETCVYDENDELVKDEKGRGIKDGTNWYVSDEIEPDASEDDRKFKGTEDELTADLSRRWARFVESDEAKAYIARRKEIRDEARAEMLAEIKEKGRYEVSYGPAPDGDTVKKEGNRDWKGSRSIYTVRDTLVYREIEKMDGPDKALGVETFIEDPEYDGNCSPEWEARVEDIRAAGRESHRLAAEEVQRLNDQWARDGYPLPKEWIEE